MIDADERADTSVDEISDRLKKAVKLAGGNTVVAEKIGMHVSTLNNYIAGRDMKASALVALARGCEVSIEWLATGNGPMRPGQPSPGSGQLIPGFLDELATSRAHFWALFTLIHACQQSYKSANVAPTLLDVFQWIGPPYEKFYKVADNPLALIPIPEVSE